MSYEYYELLGIPRNASAEEIKKAYRKKAMELHPDRNQGDKTKEAQFKKVNEAYSILSDPQKRAVYDQTGSYNEGAGMGGAGGFNMNFDMNDIFESFFGGGFGEAGRQGGRHRRQIGGDVEIRLAITFEEAYLGGKKSIKVNRKVVCPDCDGHGGANNSKIISCPDCHGHGKVKKRVQTIFGIVEQVIQCEKCSGSGKIFENICKTCRGQGYTEGKSDISIDIPAGIDDGMTMKLHGEGDWGKDGKGDLYVTFQVPQSFENLKRNEYSISSEIYLDPVDLVLGKKFEMTFPLLGKKTITIAPGTQIHEKIEYRGEGFKKIQGSGKGDFTLHILCRIPQKLSAEELSLYEQLRKEGEGDKKSKSRFFGL